MTKPLKTPEEPAFLREINPNACLKTSEIAKIFGYTVAGLQSAIEQGNFPHPDRIHQAKFTDGHRYFTWKTTTVRKEISRRQALLNQHREPAHA